MLIAPHSFSALSIKANEPIQSFRGEMVGFPILGQVAIETESERVEPWGEVQKASGEKTWIKRGLKNASNVEMVSVRNPEELEGLEWSDICSIFDSSLF